MNFLAYDTETTGLDLNYDQIIEIGMVKTDEDFNVLPGTETTLLCNFRPDVVPHPMAFATHGISVDEVYQNGIPEWQFAHTVAKYMLGQGNTGILGYNNFSYDDEMLRRLFYRNCRNPYEYAFANNNFRFDLYLATFVIKALSPDAVAWPRDDQNALTLKLSRLADANGIDHGQAHRAMADVLMTIDLARLYKQRAPAAFSHALELSNKRAVEKMIFGNQAMYLASRYISKEFDNTTMVRVLGTHATVPTKFLALDLRHDPSALLDLTPAEIAEQFYTPRDQMPADQAPLPIIVLQSNKAPGLIPLNMAPASLNERAFLDRCKVDQHLAIAEKHFAEIRVKLQEAFRDNYPPTQDVYAGLYEYGFMERTEQAHSAKLYRGEPEASLAILQKTRSYSFAAEMPGPRQPVVQQLVNRARWGSLRGDMLKHGDYQASELNQYLDYLRGRLNGAPWHNALTLDGFNDALAETRFANAEKPAMLAVLDGLAKHVDLIRQRVLPTLESLAQTHAPIAAKEAAELPFVVEIDRKVALARQTAIASKEVAVDDEVGLEL